MQCATRPSPSARVRAASAANSRSCVAVPLASGDDDGAKLAADCHRPLAGHLPSPVGPSFRRPPTRRRSPRSLAGHRQSATKRPEPSPPARCRSPPSLDAGVSEGGRRLIRHRSGNRGFWVRGVRRDSRTVHGVTILKRLMAKGLHVRVVLFGSWVCLRKQRRIDVAMGLLSFLLFMFFSNLIFKC
jgi:hypothetical protein